MNQDKAKQLVAEARKIASRAESWIALSNAITGPNGGLLAQYFPDAEERREFLRSAEYEQLNDLLRRSIARTGLYPQQRGEKTPSSR